MVRLYLPRLLLTLKLMNVRVSVLLCMKMKNKLEMPWINLIRRDTMSHLLRYTILYTRLLIKIIKYYIKNIIININFILNIDLKGFIKRSS